MAKKENESTDGEYSSQGNQVEEDTEEDGYNEEDVWIALNSFIVGRLWQWTGRAIEKARCSPKEECSEISKENKSF